MQRAERVNKDGEQSTARLTIAQAALLNMRGQELRQRPIFTIPTHQSLPDLCGLPRYPSVTYWAKLSTVCATLNNVLSTVAASYRERTGNTSQFDRFHTIISYHESFERNNYKMCHRINKVKRHA
jgi:hypothetical protein